MRRLRERKKERLRRAILEAAERLFGEQGFQGTRISDIDAAADIGEATLYRYFPSKEELLRCLHRDLARRLGGRAPSAARDVSLEEHMCALTASFFERYVEYARQNPWMAELARAMTRQPEQRGSCAGEELEQPLASLIREGRTRGEIDDSLDPKLLAALLRAMISSCFVHWKEGIPQHEAMKSHCATAIQVFFRGVRPATASPPRWSSD